MLTIENGDVFKDGRPMLCLVRKVWGDGAPTHAELDAVQRELAAVLNVQRAAHAVLFCLDSPLEGDVRPMMRPAIDGLRAALNPEAKESVNV